MTQFLSKLTRVSDNATFKDSASFWVVFAFVLCIIFYAQIVTMIVMLARAV